jgi:hypothetical protein
MNCYHSNLAMDFMRTLEGYESLAILMGERAKASSFP